MSDSQENQDTILIRFKRIVSPILLKVVYDDPNMQTCKLDDEASFIWFDGIFRLEKYIGYPPFKRVNKIPGMNKICYKSNLFNLLNNLTKKFKDQYSNCFPETIVVPINDYNSVLKKLDKKKTWILKPESSYGGKGICVFREISDIGSYPKTDFVIQRYITPKLIDGFKFDFRMYLLITDLNPLSLYIYKDGIARFCSEKYNPEDLRNMYSNLTNVSINCKNTKPDIIKEHIKLYSDVVDKFSADITREKLFEKIKLLSGKVILALYREIELKVIEACDKNDREYKESINEPNSNKDISPINRFFHLLGIDILIDENFDPYILELNDNPALKCFNDLENVLKEKLIKSEISLINKNYHDGDDNIRNKEYIGKDHDGDDNLWEKIDFKNGPLNKIKRELMID